MLLTISYDAWSPNDNVQQWGFSAIFKSYRCRFEQSKNCDSSGTTFTQSYHTGVGAGNRYWVRKRMVLRGFSWSAPNLKQKLGQFLMKLCWTVCVRSPVSLSMLPFIALLLICITNFKNNWIWEMTEQLSQLNMLIVQQPVAGCGVMDSV